MRLLGLPRWFLGEATGTFLLVFFGCGSIATSVLTGARLDVFEVAVLWGLGIAAAIHLTADLSGAHLNPAVTVALAAWGGFRWRLVPGYALAQFLGAFAASAAVYGVFQGYLASYEASHHIARGLAGSEASAMVFGEFFPNPDGLPLNEAARALVPARTAACAEALGTGILALVVLGANSARNAQGTAIPASAAIGLTITLLISLLGPVTLAAFNPARDLAPRAFSALAGWGQSPFTVNGSGWLCVYILAPVGGALAGGALHRCLFRPGNAAP